MKSRSLPAPLAIVAVVLFLGILYGLRELAPVFICFVVE